MSNERKWANRKELGNSALVNYDSLRNLTMFQFVASYDGDFFDKYVQAKTIDEAKEIFLDLAIEDELDLTKLDIYSLSVPANDVLKRLTLKTRD
jgi:hypothetical protein